VALTKGTDVRNVVSLVCIASSGATCVGALGALDTAPFIFATAAAALRQLFCFRGPKPVGGVSATPSHMELSVLRTCAMGPSDWVAAENVAEKVCLGSRPGSFEQMVPASALPGVCAGTTQHAVGINSNEVAHLDSCVSL